MSDVFSAIGATPQSALALIGGSPTKTGLTGATASGGGGIAGSMSPLTTAMLLTYYPPPVAVGTAVQAAQSGNLAQVSPTPLPGAVTEPNSVDGFSHTLIFDFGATWSAGNSIHLSGVDINGVPRTEVVAANPGGTSESNYAYTTVTIAKQTQHNDGVGNASNTVTTTIGHSLGSTVTLVGIAGIDFVFTSPPTVATTELTQGVDAAHNTIHFGTDPNGTNAYGVFVNVSQTPGLGTVSAPTHTHAAGTLTTP